MVGQLRTAWPVLLSGLLGCGGSGSGPHTGWTLVATGLPAEQVSALAVDPTDAMIAYVGFWSTSMGVITNVGSGIYKTSDGGASWSAANTGLVAGALPSATPAIFSISIDAQQPRTVYAGGAQGMWKSTDAGVSWSSFVRPPGGSSVSPDVTAGTPAVEVDPRDSNHIYVGAAHGLWVTSDGGAAWTNLYPAAAPNAGCIRFDPAHAGVTYAHTSPIPAAGGPVPANDVRITNDTQLDDLNTPAMADSYCGVVDPTGAVYLHATDTAVSPAVDEIVVSTDEGASWSDAGSGLVDLGSFPGISFAARPPVAGVLYAVVQTSQSSDAGTATVGRLFKLARGAWTDVTESLPAEVDVVATGTSDPSIVYVGTTDGRVYRSGGAL